MIIMVLQTVFISFSSRRKQGVISAIYWLNLNKKFNLKTEVHVKDFIKALFAWAPLHLSGVTTLPEYIFVRFTTTNLRCNLKFSFCVVHSPVQAAHINMYSEHPNTNIVAFKWSKPAWLLNVLVLEWNLKSHRMNQSGIQITENCL